MADRSAMNVEAPLGWSGLLRPLEPRQMERPGIGRRKAPPRRTDRQRRRLYDHRPDPAAIGPHPGARETAPVRRAGLKGIVRPTGYPQRKLSAIVQSVGGIPLAAKEFDTRLTLANDDDAAAVVPGMSCDVKLLVYQKADALVVPLAAVGSDDTSRKSSMCPSSAKMARRPVAWSRRGNGAISRWRSSRAWRKGTRFCQCGNDLVGPSGSKDEK